MKKILLSLAACGLSGMAMAQYSQTFDFETTNELRQNFETLVGRSFTQVSTGGVANSGAVRVPYSDGRTQFKKMLRFPVAGPIHLSAYFFVSKDSLGSFSGDAFGFTLTPEDPDHPGSYNSVYAVHLSAGSAVDSISSVRFHNGLGTNRSTANFTSGGTYQNQHWYKVDFTVTKLAAPDSISCTGAIYDCGADGTATPALAAGFTRHFAEHPLYITRQMYLNADAAQEDGAKYFDKLQVEAVDATGIPQLVRNDELLTIYPTVSNGLVTVSCASLSGDARIRVLDLNGKQMLETRTREEKTVLDLTSLVPATYFVEMITGNTRSVQRIVRMN